MNGHHGVFSFVMLALVAAATGGYLLAAWRQWCSGRRWPWLRVGFCLGGSFLLALSLLPAVMHHASLDLRWHMGQHVLMGMFAPLLLVLAAPVTLLLRSMPVTAARPLAGLLGSPLPGFLSHPLTALVLNIGGMYLLYATPLYAASLESAALHNLVHIHFILAGYLFCQAILGGPDKTAASAGFGLRLGVLMIAIATHAILGKLMFGYLWPVQLDYSTQHIQAAAKLMYYAGDLAEMLLLIVLLAGGRLTRSQPLPLVRV